MIIAGLMLAALPATTPLGAQTAVPVLGDGIVRGPAPAWVPAVELLPAPTDARGAVFFRRQQAVIHLGSDGQMSYNGYRVRLLHPNALQLGNLAITWNPAVGPPSVHAITIHRDGEAIDVLANHQFEILRREDMLEASMINGLLTATLQVPDLRIGDELEVAFTTPSSNPTLPDTDFGLFFLADAPPPGRFNISLAWEDGYEPALRPTADLAPMIQRTANSLTIAADNPPAITPPRDAPARYHWTRIVEFSDFPSWNAISQRFHSLFAEASRLPADSPLKQEAARIAARHPDSFARAAAALELVEQQTRYIFVGLNQGGFTPANADETWARRYGDCKGKTVLLLALLHELGIEAEAVLVSNSGLDDGLDQRLPNPGLFDHVLVRAQIDGQTWWLDGTYPAVARPTLRPLVPYRWVLPLSDAGAAIEHLPFVPHELPREIEVWDIDASDGFATDARIRQQTVLRGPDALNQYLQLSAATDQQLEDALRSELAGTEKWTTIEDVTYRFDTAAQAGMLTISGTGPLDWTENGGQRRSMTLPGGGFSPPGRLQRSADQDQTAPFAANAGFDCTVTTVRLPRDTQPEQWSHNTAFGKFMYASSYRRMFERRGMEMRMIRVRRREMEETSAERAAADNARLADFDNSMARIEYDPDDNFQSSARVPVPAADEVDWLTDTSACAPAQIMVTPAVRSK